MQRYHGIRLVPAIAANPRLAIDAFNPRRKLSKLYDVTMVGALVICDVTGGVAEDENDVTSVNEASSVLEGSAGCLRVLPAAVGVQPVLRYIPRIALYP